MLVRTYRHTDSRRWELRSYVVRQWLITGNVWSQRVPTFRSIVSKHLAHFGLCTRSGLDTETSSTCWPSDPNVTVAKCASQAIKKRLAEQFPTDVESYIAGKTDFLLELLLSAGVPEAVLQTIRDVNRKN